MDCVCDSECVWMCGYVGKMMFGFGYLGSYEVVTFDEFMGQLTWDNWEVLLELLWLWLESLMGWAL